MKKEENFFVTTPIYYTNWIPHIWHAYSSIIADVIARYNKINWKKVKFCTWVDENSQKAVQKAKDEWMEIMDYLDMMAEKHKQVWDWLDIKYTDFIRTTEKRHHDFVKKVLQTSFDNWDIYQWEYEWKYCIWCEAFKKDDDLIIVNWKKVCPDHLTEPDIIKEKNYFFRLSKYQDFLLEFYKNNPEFVIPQDRFNEVIAFVKRWLDDFSISRETNKFGITLPFDETQVTYVWYDALFNYLTVCQNWDEDFWPADLHIVWKDILRFHAIFWPAMLKSAWYDLPKQILATGYFTIDWQKISKSLWNVIDPVEFTQKYSKDLLTLYLLSSFNIWQDWDFSEKQAILTYNSKLANNLWNLVNRVVVLALKLSEKNWILEIKNELNNFYKINEKNEKIYNNHYLINKYWLWAELWRTIESLYLLINNYIKNYDLKWYLDNIFLFLDKLNKFAEEKKPRIMIKEDEEGTREVLYTLSEWLRQVWLCLYPFFPDKMGEMFEKLWLENYSEDLENWWLEELRNKTEIFKIKEKWEVLFKRFDI